MQPTLKPVLRKIAERLFTPRYTVTQLKEELGLTNDGLMNAFGAAVGLAPWSFIRECRLETAARLLRDTTLPVIEITLLVGYDSEPSFSHLFHAWSRMRPKEYRAHARAVMAMLGIPPEEIFSWPRWERICDRGLGAEEAGELIAAIEMITSSYPFPQSQVKNFLPGSRGNG